eukprot:Amastigsp_a514189_8.p2 type:complete len:183 gc:universal Amastigsp_a514189_8:940-392(-)
MVSTTTISMSATPRSCAFIPHLKTRLSFSKLAKAVWSWPPKSAATPLTARASAQSSAVRRWVSPSTRWHCASRSRATASSATVSGLSNTMSGDGCESDGVAAVQTPKSPTRRVSPSTGCAWPLREQLVTGIANVVTSVPPSISCPPRDAWRTFDASHGNGEAFMKSTTALSPKSNSWLPRHT